jgi:hypothetical protein
MTDFAKNSEDMPKNPGRKNFLRNAAVAVTSCVVLCLFLLAVPRNN